MKLSFKKIPQSVYVAGFLALGVLAYVGYVTAATSDVTGYACSTNIGCISLHPTTSSQAPDFAAQPAFPGVTFNTATGEFGGEGWSPIVGPVKFGIACSAAIIQAEGAAAAGSKCARVSAITGSTAVQNGGWDGYIYLGGVQLAPDGISFTGRGWDGNNTNGDSSNPSDTGIGWLTFTASLQGDTGACGTAVNSNSQPTTNLCAVGSASTPSGGGSSPWTWTCSGSSGAATCSTPNPNRGFCGTAAGVIQNTEPTSGLCYIGTVDNMSSGSPYSWTCTGADAVPVACSALSMDMPAACGNVSSPCSIGYLVPGSIQGSGNNYTWACYGIGSFASTEYQCSSTSTPGGPLKPIYKEN